MAVAETKTPVVVQAANQNTVKSNSNILENISINGGNDTSRGVVKRIVKHPLTDSHKDLDINNS